ncbi:MAG: hypothetical protein QW506_01535 [Thermoproteota archaeon]
MASHRDMPRVGATVTGLYGLTGTDEAVSELKSMDLRGWVTG